MVIHRLFCAFILLLLTSASGIYLHAQEKEAITLDNQLLQDLLIVNYWDCCHSLKMPVFYNHLLQGGYFNMPSARMGKEGEIAFGYASVPPYLIWSGRCQLNHRVEVSGNYRIFKGIPDPILSEYGFGDLSDKGANVKCALFLPEDSDYLLPGIAFGFEDFLGTRNFKARYIVATQVFPAYDFEISLGYGAQRIYRWFGGMAWMPFRRTRYTYLRDLALVAEYDATPYCDPNIELHPKGRLRRTHMNPGIKYRFGDNLDFSLAYVRGHDLAFTASAFYNFGYTEGFLPKIDDPLPYRAPINREPLSERRSPQWLTAELLFALRDQGFTLLEATLVNEGCENDTLRLRVYNEVYRQERQVLQRLSYLLAALVPEDIYDVTVIIDTEGLPIQEYRIPVAFLRRYGNCDLCESEFAIMAPMREVSSFPDFGTYQCLYSRSLPLWCVCLLPKTNFFFGSSKGKLKFALGASLYLDGFLYEQIYYNVVLSCTFFEDMHASQSIDRLNPSQVINVRSDILRYYQKPGLSVDVAYLQRCWNLGCGWYARAALGLFEIEYGGAVAELLYYPVNRRWAFGAEAACLRKRTLRGIGFSDKVRKLCGFQGHYRGFLGSQAFFNAYYDWKETNLDLRVKVGKFLANDVGVRYEVSRYFPSGMRVTFWYTRTNACDRINGERYFDKGVAITMPLDIFYTCCSKGKWSYGMSAWLRDVGVIASHGQDLYDMIYEQRKH